MQSSMGRIRVNKRLRVYLPQWMGNLIDDTEPAEAMISSNKSLDVVVEANGVMDGNTDGAVMQHLQPCSALLAQHNLLDRVDSDCACFIAEQYMFLGVVNEYLGLGPVANIVQPTATVTSDFMQLPYQSYYHGRSSGCGYALFEMVPRIALFATKPGRSSPRYLDPEIKKEFDMLEEEILLWDIPTSLNSTTGPDNDEVTAALIQQVALLVTLQCALNGPGMPAPCIQTKIEACVCESRKLLRSISPSSAAWGTLLWPAIHIGSCITSLKEQNELVSAILSMENKTHCCTRLMQFLSSLWVALRDDGMYYGPYGIRPLMDREGIKLSLG
ncbi:hypothetical protein PENARI_c034G08304 [Penicillium arizonense]|uniref:Transcription factor domain-containing protein n=1 Tax=Penicillium arizonense TaxID=1835702 RepID=A0A1F5L3Z7_PENAI|nr:hypothetical protein PENARI_c034G08304 [Penicillium arizonense]OGE47958.1 hypothetical protein PENARI_c034G08304 [Penicillium arizonense]